MVIYIRELYNVYSHYLGERYGAKVYKLPITLGGTCPNRDGKLGYGGCHFCGEEGGSFENLDPKTSVAQQIAINKDYIGSRYGAEKFIAYFQNYTNTYMPFDNFKDVILEAAGEDVVGIYISSRPDTISIQQLEFLRQVKEEKGVDILFEIGLQTSNYRVLDRINRGHGLGEFIDSIIMSKKYGIESCVHVIIGLPGDERIDTIETATILSALEVEQVKLHALYVLEGTVFGEMYKKDELELISLEEYVDRAILFLRHLSEDVVVQRLVGRSTEEASLFSNWETSWWKIRDMIVEKMKENNYKQGDLCHLIKKGGI